MAFSGQLLDILEQIPSMNDKHIDLVLSSQAPCLNAVKKQIAKSKLKINLLSNVKDMATLMIKSDLAFGAAGSTSWERCCLGLPTVLFVVAENQKLIAENLDNVGAVQVCKSLDLETLNASIMAISNELINYSRDAAELCDGLGVDRVINIIKKGNVNSSAKEVESSVI